MTMSFSCNMKLTDPSDALAFLEENKYRLLFAEVKHVLTGSILMVSLLRQSQLVKLIIAGVQAPSPGKDAIQESQRVDGKKKNRKKFVSRSPLKFECSGAEAFGKEAKEFTEIRLMHNDVRIILEGIDKYNNFIGLVYYADGEIAKNLGLELIEKGLAKYDQRSGNLSEESTRFDFMNAEIEAQKSRLRIWDDSTSLPSTSSKAIHDKNFTETVRESHVQEQVEAQVMEQHANHFEEQVDHIHDIKEQAVENMFWEPVDHHPIYDSKEQVENLFWEQVQNHIEEDVIDQTHDTKQEQVQNHIEKEVVDQTTDDTKQEQVQIDSAERVQNLVEEQAKEIIHFEERVANGPPNAKRSHKEEIKVVVTNVLGGCKFYVQSVDDLSIVSIQKQIASFKLSPEQQQEDHLTTNFNPKIGDFVLAQCEADDSWNRAMIVDTPAQEAHDEESSNDADAEYEVFYVDDGNKKRISLNRLRPLVFSISSAPGVAQLCSLAHVIIHDDPEAENFLRAQLLSKDSKQFTAVVEERSTNTSIFDGQLGLGSTETMLKVTLIDEDEDVSINAKLLQAGLARLDKSGEDGDEISDELIKYEDEARKNKCGMWKYNHEEDGDVLSDEDDEEIASRDEVSIMEEKVAVNGCDDDGVDDDDDDDEEDEDDIMPTLIINDINFPKLESIRLVH